MRDKEIGDRLEEKVTIIIGDESFHYHSNGGGLVADTASVAETVHVAPMARVFGEAQLSGNVQVTGRARVGGSVIASGRVIFGGTSITTEGTYEGSQIVYKK